MSKAFSPECCCDSLVVHVVTELIEIADVKNQICMHTNTCLVVVGTCMCRFNFDLDKGPISIEWFSGAETNIAYNCLDRHVEAGKGDKIAMYWEGNDLVCAP